MTDVRISIVEWLKSQPKWVQVVSNKILRGEKITEVILKEILALVKTEDGQKAGQSLDFSYLLNSMEAGFELKIKSVGKIIGIDDLAPRVPLDFKGNITVVYGHNGSGKSGYTRIIKKASGKGETFELIPNVYSPKPDIQKCTFQITENGTDHEIEWVANSSPLDSLKGVDIFDTSAGGIYLEGENEASYLPKEVALFETLVTVYDQLKFLIDKEIKLFPIKLPFRPSDFGDTKYLKAMYVNLKHDSDKEKVRDFFKYSEEDENKKQRLEERIKTAPETLATLKRNRKKQIQKILDSIVAATKLVDNERCLEISKLKKEVELKRKIALESVEAMKELTTLSGVGTETWKSMWSAAKKYSEEVAYQGLKYPNVADESVCILCQQTLDDEAKTRLVGFESFVTSKLELELRKVSQAYEKRLSELPLIPDEGLLKTSIQASQLEENEWFEKINKIWTGIKDVKSILQKNESYDVQGVTFDLNELILLRELISKLEEEALIHDQDSKAFDLKNVQSELNEIKSKKWAAAFLDVMIEEIDRLSQIERLNGWMKLLSTRGITAKSGEVSEQYITEAYVKRFNDELKALGANKIGVELIKTKATKGSVKHKLRLKNLNPTYIKVNMSPLSEGEKRIVSLAAFLADVTNKPYKTPFVFDDPISSLDQLFEEKTANRLIALSQGRQVIVFTHRLSLMGLLTDNKSIEAHCKHLRRESWGCGEHGTVPLYGKRPISAINELKNDRLSKARNVYKEKGVEEYNPLAKSICSDFRILLERVIETDLMFGIVQRHKRAITSKDKMKLLTKICLDDCELFENLMSEFSVFEHSQTEEAPAELPTPDEILIAIDKVISWHTKFTSEEKSIKKL